MCFTITILRLVKRFYLTQSVRYFADLLRSTNTETIIRNIMRNCTET